MAPSATMHCCTQGYNPRSGYAAPHQLQLGWSSEVATLGARNLRYGTALEFTLPALASSRKSVLVVNVDWETQPSASVQRGGYLTLSFRSRIAQDAGLPDEYNQAVSVHRIQQLYSNPYVEAVVQDGQRWDEPLMGLSIRVSLPPLGTQATVRVCRFFAESSECTF